VPKAVVIAVLTLLCTSVALAQDSEYKTIFMSSQLTAGPGDPVDPLAALSLEPDERDRLGSLGSQRLDHLLREAISLRSTRATGEILKAGADPDGLAPFRGLPLLYAASAHTDALVRLLLRYGADPTIVPPQGKTALMRAASYGRSETLKVLLEAGADVNVWDHYGKTALDYAVDGNHSDCAEILRAFNSGASDHPPPLSRQPN